MAYKSKYAQMMVEAAAEAELARFREAIARCDEALLRAMCYAELAGIDFGDSHLWEKAIHKDRWFFLSRKNFFSQRNMLRITSEGVVESPSLVDKSLDAVCPRHDAAAAVDEWLRECLRWFGRAAMYGIQYARLVDDARGVLYAESIEHAACGFTLTKETERYV